MIFISLGRHCDVAYNIKNYITKDQPTHFFDWLRIDFKCVLYILNLDNIECIFNKENINIDKISFAECNDILFTLKNFEDDNLICLFHHEVRIKDFENNEENKINEFIEKYKRRFNRLIDLIKIKNYKSDPIVFIYRVTSDFDEINDVNDFKNIILKINKNCVYYLVILVDTEEDYLSIKEANYLKINISTLTDKNINPNWIKEDINWEKVFNIIKKNFLLESFKNKLFIKV
jgi:hypothetical protein